MPLLNPTPVRPLPATGRGPAPTGTGLLNPEPPSATAKAQSAIDEQSAVLQPPGGLKPRFGQPDLNPKPIHQGPLVGEGGVILAGAGLALSVAQFGAAAVVNTLAPLVLGGRTIKEAVGINALFLASPAGRKFFHFSFALFLPHTETDPRQQRTMRFLGLPFQDLDTTSFKFEQQQLRLQWIRVADMVERDLGTASGQARAELESIAQQLATFKQSFRVTSALGFSVTEPDFITDLARLISLRRQVEIIEHAWQLDTEGGWGGPLTGTAVSQGDKADP